jgi:hypothetical protein
MKYLVSEVEKWGKEIDAMPAPDPGRRRVGKKEAVILLAKKLRAELLDVLAAKGLKVHADTLRAALKVGGRGAVTCPVRSRRIAGGPKGLREGNGPASGTASGRPNAGGSVGDRPEQRADVVLSSDWRLAEARLENRPRPSLHPIRRVVGRISAGRSGTGPSREPKSTLSSD